MKVTQWPKMIMQPRIAIEIEHEQYKSIGTRCGDYAMHPIASFGSSVHAVCLGCDARRSDAFLGAFHMGLGSSSTRQHAAELTMTTRVPCVQHVRYHL